MASGENFSKAGRCLLREGRPPFSRINEVSGRAFAAMFMFLLSIVFIDSHRMSYDIYPFFRVLTFFDRRNFFKGEMFKPEGLRV